jgi:hypothetical protein
MWWRAFASGVAYSSESWLLIPVLWFAPVAGAAMSFRSGSAGPLFVICSALFASTYFMDVLGFIPGAVIAACGIEAFLRERFGGRTSFAREM